MKKCDIVICVNPGELDLTRGKRYKVMNTTQFMIGVKNDLGIEAYYLPERFIIDEVEIAKKIINFYNLLETSSLNHPDRVK